MDIHTRIAAALHIICGMIGAFFMLMMALMLKGFAVALQLPEIPGFLMGIGVTFAVVFMLLALAETVAGIALLRGSPVGRGFVIAFGIVHLLNFPLGTLLGIYTLWALLRKSPASSDVVA